MRIKKKTGIAIFLGLFIIAFSVKAADVVMPSQDQQNVTVGSAETRHNLYAAGGNVTVNGKTTGDLVAAGGMIVLEGTVEEDVLAAGGTLNINSQIGGDVRVAGGNIIISSPIGGDLIIGGGNINITGKSSIGADLIMGAGNATLDAPVRGKAKIAGGNVTINSKIDGDVWVQASQQLTFGPSAQIAGQVYYKGPKQAILLSGATVPNINYTLDDGRSYRRELMAIFTVFFLIKLLAWVIVGLLMVKLAKGVVESVSAELKENPWEGLAWGAVTAIIVPVAAVLLLITGIGYYLALVLGLGLALIGTLAFVLAAVSLGYLVLGYLNKTDPVTDWQAVVVGVVLWHLISLIPILGWIALAILYIMVFGLLVRKVKGSFNK